MTARQEIDPPARRAARRRLLAGVLACLAAAGLALPGASAQASSVALDTCECLLLPGDQAVVEVSFANTSGADAELLVALTLPNGRRFFFSEVGLVETPSPLEVLPAGASGGPLAVIDLTLDEASLPFGNWPLVPPFRYAFHALLLDPQTGALLATPAAGFFDFEPYPPADPPTEPGVLHLVPHQHADVAWLDREDVNLRDAADWIADSILETREDPSYRFVIDQPFVLREFAARHPSLVGELQQLIDDGSVEVAGGLYVQPDLNLLSGESLARQMIYGQRYLERSWGHRARIGWNIDSFGHPHQMPQLVRQGGMHHYAMSRGIPFPSLLGLLGGEFHWESPDGSRVLVNHLPFGYQLGRSFGDTAPDDAELNELFAVLAPTSSTGHFMTGVGADVSEHVLNPLVPEAVALWNAARPPGIEARISTPSDLFAEIEASGVSLPTLSNIEFQDDAEVDDPRIFPGVYAARVEIKQTNQTLEHALLDAEKLATLAWIEGAAYPEATLREAGERIAVNQFHDYLPGTGVDAIYQDADDEIDDLGDRAAAVRSALDQELATATAYLADRIDTQLPGESVQRRYVVFNSMAWMRRDVVRVDLGAAGLPQPARLLDADGAEIAYQLRKSVEGATQLLFVAEIPALGYATFFLVDGAPAASPTEVSGPLPASGLARDLGQFRVFFDANGLLRGVFANSSSEALVQLPDTPPTIESQGGLLWWGEETFGNAYDYGPAFSTGTEAHPMVVAQMEGPVTTRILATGPVSGASYALREAQIFPQLGRIEFHTRVYWQEQNKNLYVRFPFEDGAGKQITEGVPYGHRARGPGHFPALRWADWGSATSGISVLNQGLFGHHFSLDPSDPPGSGARQVLDITLLRSMDRAVFGEFASQSMKGHGQHDYRYSLLPHHGSWREAQTPRRAWELGSPLRAVETTDHAGALPTRRSYFTLGAASDAVLSVLQVDGSDVVVRLYEANGEAGEQHLRFPFLDAVTIDRTNFLGDFTEALGSGTAVDVATAPEEIVTLRLGMPRITVPAQGPTTDQHQVIDLGTSDAFRLSGIDDGDLAGRALSAIGDIDGDGYDDLVIAANQADGPGNTGEEKAGEVYVVFGGPRSRFEGGASLDQADMTLYGFHPDTFAGTRVTSGDLDGDGFDEIIIGSLGNPTGELARSASGVTWVYFGGPRSTLPGAVDLATEADLVVWGQPGDIAGVHVTVGDIDGDGLDDLIIGAPSSDGEDDLTESAGEGYILFGGPRADVVRTGTRVLGLHHDTVIYGAEPFDHTFWAAETGDVDADGYDDIVFGAIDADGSGPQLEAAGDVYVFWGAPRAALQDAEFRCTSLDNMSLFYGIDRGDLAGFNFDLDDVDGDGYEDILIASPFADGLDNLVGDITGEAYLIFGRPRAEFAASQELADVVNVTFYGGLPDESAGHTVFLADLTGDGLAEVILGAPVADGFQGQRPGSGTTHVLFGRPRAEWDAQIVLGDQSSNLMIRGGVDFEALGFALSAGDVDGDGSLDLVIGSPFYAASGRDRQGMTYVLFQDDLIAAPTDSVRITRAEYDPASGVLRVAATSNVGAAAFRRENEIFVYDGSSIAQITDNEFPEQRLRLRGDWLVYDRNDGEDSEVFLHDGTSELQLTDNTTEDRSAVTDGSLVAWMGFDGQDYEIFIYDGVSVTQLTDNALEDAMPRVADGQVVWQGFDGNDFEIFVYDGVDVLQLTDDTHQDQTPRISQGQVVWTGEDGSDFEIYFWDGSTTRQLTDNAASDGAPDIDAGRVTWAGYDGADFEIFLWDGATTTQLSSNAIPDYSPRISGGRVVWNAGSDEAAEIMFYDGGTAQALTANSIADVEPVIDGATVAWRTQRARDGEKSEVFVYDGVSVSQLTDNDDDETHVGVSGARIAWLANTVQTTLTIPGIGSLQFDPKTGVYSGSFVLAEAPPSITVESPLGGAQTVAVISLPAADPALAPAALTDDGDPRDDRDPRIWAGQVVWSGYDGEDYEIFVSDGLTTTQLTDNAEDDLNPRIRGGEVVWEGFDGNDVEIFHWDGSAVRQVTDNGADDLAPQVDAGAVVWQGRVGSTFEIFLDQAGVTTQLTDNAFNDVLPRIENGAIVWQGYDGVDFEIYRSTGGAAERLTDNGFDDLEPVLDGDVVLWRGFDGNDYEIFRHAAGVTTQLTADGFNAFALSASDGVAVWQQTDGSDPEIFRWEAGVLLQITDNAIRDLLPQTQGGSIVWQADAGTGLEIFRYDGATQTTTRLTQNSWVDEKPQIYGDQVVWSGRDRGEPDLDVFLHDGATTRNLTDNSNAIRDVNPHTAAGIVVWERWDGDPEIMASDGQTTVQLSSNAFEDLRARVDPATGHVVWQALDDVRVRLDQPGEGEGGQGATIVGGDFEIFTWDGQAVTRRTNREKLDDAVPWIHAGQILWVGGDGNDLEVFFDDGSGAIQLTDNAFDEQSPRLHKGRAVWQGWDGSDMEIFYWDGSTIAQLTDNGTSDVSPEIYGDDVVWAGHDGTDFEIFHWNALSGLTTQITANSGNDVSPQVENGKIVWQGFDGEDWEIYFFDGTSVRALTDNALRDERPRMKFGRVVWQTSDTFDFEIFYWDGRSVHRLTDNTGDDVNAEISGTSIVWQGYDGVDFEIFSTEIPKPRSRPRRRR